MNKVQLSQGTSWELQPLKYQTTTRIVELNVDLHDEGTSQTDDFLIYRKGTTFHIYDRVCDHSNGKLALVNGEGVCPLHAWKLDLETGQYLTANCKKDPLLVIDEHELDSPVIEVSVVKEVLECLPFDKSYPLTVEFLNHACLYFEVENGVKFATDPWVIGSAFNNGWWLVKNSPADVFEKLNACDFIYVSHNHPDHLHFPSLEHIRKDMPIVTADFISESTEALLKQAGFTHIIPMDFKSRYVAKEAQFSISVLKSGDFRDDSGLLVEIGEFKCLLTVDSNFLNFSKLPENVDLLCSAFAGGASGFPLCFENYSEEEKLAIIGRNRNAIKATNRKTVELCNPNYFMPYAGFFTERAPRDAYVKERNLKNASESYDVFSRKFDYTLLNCDEKQIFRFAGKKLIEQSVRTTPDWVDHNVDYYLQKVRDDNRVLSDEEILNYFNNSNFHDELVLKIELTSDDFEQTTRSFLIEFDKVNLVRSQVGAKEDRFYAQDEFPKRFLRIKSREFEFYDVLQNAKPWEDLSIGFQTRVFRTPNVYNSDFWFHFTNQYIGQRVSLEPSNIILKSQA